MPKIPGWEKADSGENFNGEGWVHVHDDYGKEITMIVYYQQEDGTWLVELNKMYFGVTKAVKSIVPLLNAKPDKQEVVAVTETKKESRAKALQYMRNNPNGWI